MVSECPWTIQLGAICVGALSISPKSAFLPWCDAVLCCPWSGVQGHWRLGLHVHIPSGVPVQSCLGCDVFPAAFLASRSSSWCSRVCNTQSPHGGKRDGVTSELPQMVLNVVKENNIWERIASTSLSPVLSARNSLPRCLFLLPSNACRAACLWLPLLSRSYYTILLN